MRGETCAEPRRCPTCRGLSPRARGNLGDACVPCRVFGSIPTCAGKPAAGRANSRGRRVYPHVRGETDIPGLQAATDQGLSPRARGNLIRPLAQRSVRGSIPTCAGKPAPTAATPSPIGVYPHVRGETGADHVEFRAVQGLSPRARGNRSGRPVRRFRSGSIPTCAGKPLRTSRRLRRRWVYPHVRGETDAMDRLSDLAAGLSPRARGNRVRTGFQGSCGGSIPTCAGKPCRLEARRSVQAVYPHVRGETCESTYLTSHWKGLSPRARGNLWRPCVAADAVGSIPTCAGKPRCSARTGTSTRVYPHVRGETHGTITRRSDGRGLSPRARGNPKARA